MIIPALDLIDGTVVRLHPVSYTHLDVYKRQAENMPIDILRVRDDDIPGLVMDGVVDLGIIGENVLEEELLNPVSYTHLDVYKRQGLQQCAFRRRSHTQRFLS